MRKELRVIAVSNIAIISSLHAVVNSTKSRTVKCDSDHNEPAHRLRETRGVLRWITPSARGVTV